MVVVLHVVVIGVVAAAFGVVSSLLAVDFDAAAGWRRPRLLLCGRWKWIGSRGCVQGRVTGIRRSFGVIVRRFRTIEGTTFATIVDVSESGRRRRIREVSRRGL